MNKHAIGVCGAVFSNLLTLAVIVKTALRLRTLFRLRLWALSPIYPKPLTWTTLSDDVAAMAGPSNDSGTLLRAEEAYGVFRIVGWSLG